MQALTTSRAWKHRLMCDCSVLPVQRRGFTILELLVVIAIVTLLISLIMPAVLNARGSAQQLSCKNNLRQLALGALNKIDTSNRLPYAHRSSRDSKGRFLNRSNWVTEILPWIDQQNIDNEIDRFESLNDFIEAGGTRYHVPVLTCPADKSITGQDDLSYGANVGLAQAFSGETNKDFYFFLSNRGQTIDLNGDGRIDYHKNESPGTPDAATIQFATSVFQVVGDKGDFPGLNRPASHRPSTMTDGLSNTIMLIENVRCGVDPKDEESGWTFTTAARLSAGIPDLVCNSTFCGEGSVDLSKTNSGIGRINSGLTLPEGTAPWANSFHAAGVNAAFADGRVQFVSESIDGRVLFRMYTPQDTRLDNTAFRSNSANVQPQ